MTKLHSRLDARWWWHWLARHTVQHNRVEVAPTEPSVRYWSHYCRTCEMGWGA